MKTMITKILVSTLLVVATLGFTTNTVFAGEYARKFAENKVLRILQAECDAVRNTVNKSITRKRSGFSLSQAKAKTLSGIRSNGSRHGSDEERVYMELVEFGYQGGDPLYAQAMCMDEDPNFLAKEYRDAVNQARSNPDRLVMQ
ncbi:hypothetical protein ACFLY0_02375 [Patescibacteria group bacterium]